MKKAASLIFYIVCLAGLSACEKWKDPNPDPDPRIAERKYCNDPQAVNYNWDFPGVADSTVCIYPANLYEGTSSFTDSVYNMGEELDSAASLKVYTLQLIPVSKVKLQLAGFCPANVLLFTAERTTYRAVADTTLKYDDTTFFYGQPLCRIEDTLTGSITKQRYDSTGKTIYIEWMVVSDSGVNYHKGTAIKQ